MAKTTKWYSVRAKALASGSASAEVYIYGDIGETWYGESVTAADFVKEIVALDVQSLTIRINSFGGSVADGIAIYNAIKRHPAKTTVCIDGIAASIASLIAMAGDVVEIAENAMIMVHAPWWTIAGNSAELRKSADELDEWSNAMATSYAGKTGKSMEEVLSLLTDGVDHWYTADQALAEGFVDSTTAALPVAASASFDEYILKNRFQNLPAALAGGKPIAAAAAQTEEVVSMPGEVQAASQTQAAQNENEIRSRALREDAERRDDISAAFGKFVSHQGVSELMAACQSDPNCSAADAGKKLLAHLGSGATPLNAGHVVTVEDARDKFRAGMVESILARASIPGADGKPRVIAANPYRGMRLLDMARACLDRAGIRTEGKNSMEIVAAAFTQSGNDFPVLLENTMHKALQLAYSTAPDTWTRWCAIGTVSDFRAHSRYRLGSIGNVDSLNELGEFTTKNIPDGEKASITAGTKGNIISISRKAVINDDLAAFIGLASMFGRAFRRTIESDAYAFLLSNPVMDDGYALFSAKHGNLVDTGSGGVPSVAAFDAGRVKMANQKDVSGNDFLDLRPDLFLGPIGLGGEARVINDAGYDPDTPNKLQRPNKVRGLFSDVIDTPRLSGESWYMLANPSDAPVFEVDFLDGVQEPYLELQNGFDVDGARYKGRLDYGIAAIDYRGAFKNAGK